LRAWPACALAAALLACAAARAETVELLPDRRASWGLNRLFAPLTGLFLGGPSYWYEPRSLEVETTPPGATLDLFYVRGNMQRAYEQAEAPVTLVLPSRIEATSRDSVTIRALVDGYRQQDVHVRVRSRQTHVQIDLAPLPNLLVAASHVSFAGRGSLQLLLKEAPTFRLQRGEGGVTLILLETAQSPQAAEMLRGLASALVGRVSAQQAGEDLLMRIESDAAAQGEVEVRSSTDFDPVRRLHRFALNLIPPDHGAEGVRRAREALAQIEAADVSGCALEFDRALREQLDPADLAQALSGPDPLTRPHLRAALRRLGEVDPGGAIALEDGTRYQAGVPIELDAAESEASHALGYLALLRSLVAKLEPEPYRRATLRSLVAPQTVPSSFDAALAGAEAREARCLAAGTR
jgi:hypothetical protein